MLPIFAPGGEDIGCLDEFSETTPLVTGQRHRQTIGRMSDQIGSASTLPELWAGALEGFARSEVDIPWALLFEVVDDDVNDADSSTASSPEP